jgi:hypothetical protein
MPYKPLAEIRVEHPFYASGLCAGARVVPEPATAARLRGLRILPREAPGVLTLFADLADGGGTTIPIPSTTLVFSVLELPPELAAATDPADIARGTVFTDAGATKPMKPVVREGRAQETLVKPDGTVKMVLGGRPLAGVAAAAFKVTQSSAAGVSVTAYEPAGNRITVKGPAAVIDLEYPVAPVAKPGTLAAIEIGIGPQTVTQAAAGKPRRFTIALKAAAAPWCYHLVTDLANPLGQWRIASAPSDGLPVAFAGAGLSEIATPDPADPFGSELLRRSAPLRVLRFVSDAAVACSEKRARRLALFAGDRELFTALPNPSPVQTRLLGGKVAFGEVLRFVTA